ncbi:MAG: DUF1232 domain-containing protein [Deltaproteobacteria bacterium]|nr:MAG: DUF1232 domain-containing protein [Deltaproteobacteria bacterium]
MAELKVTFKLSDRDVKHLRSIMRKASYQAKAQDEDSIIKATRAISAELRKFKPPQYVLERVLRLETLVQMVEDKAYALPTPLRQKVLSTLCYFTHPEDLIQDTIPGLGFLDDAIMIELITRELKHELAAYQEFRRFRERAEQRPWTQVGQVSLDRKLSERRRQLRAKVEQKNARDAERASEGSRLLRIW